MKPEFTFGIIATVLFSASGILNKLISKHQIKDRWAFLFYYYVTYLPFLLVLLALFEISFPTGYLFLTILYGALFLIANIFFFTAIYEMDISAYTPLFEIQTFLITLLAYPILGERFPTILYLYFGVAIFGAVLASYEEGFNLRKAFGQKPFWFMILSQVVFALSNIVAGQVLEITNSPNFIFWTTVFGTLPVLLFPLTKLNEIKGGFKGALPMFISGLVVFPAALAFFKAFETNVTVPAVLLAVGTPLTFVATVSLSKIRPELLEKHPAKVYLVKGIGTMLTFVAVLLMVLGS